MVELYAQAGWHYVDATSGGEFYLWRSTRPDARPIHSDPETRRLAFDWILRKIRRGWIMCGCLTVSLLALLVWMVTQKNLVLNEVRNNVTVWPYSIFLMLWGVWQSVAEVRARSRLRRSVVSGETPPARPGCRRWYFWGAALAWLIWAGVSLTFALGMEPVYHDPPLESSLPMVSITALGGTEDPEDDYALVRTTPLARTWLWARQGRDRRTALNQPWDWPYETEVYHLRAPFLAGRLLKDLTAEKLPEGESSTPLEDARFDGGCYLRASDGDQYLTLRLGGGVLWVRADVPTDLRDHLDEFAALLKGL